jgi:hypothetical protein
MNTSTLKRGHQADTLKGGHKPFGVPALAGEHNHNLRHNPYSPRRNLPTCPPNLASLRA